MEPILRYLEDFFVKGWALLIVLVVLFIACSWAVWTSGHNRE